VGEKPDQENGASLEEESHLIPRGPLADFDIRMSDASPQRLRVPKGRQSGNGTQDINDGLNLTGWVPEDDRLLIMVRFSGENEHTATHADGRAVLLTCTFNELEPENRVSKRLSDAVQRLIWAPPGGDIRCVIGVGRRHDVWIRI